MQGKPLQYITKTQEFYGRPFTVTPDVLIPRPETELLIDVIVKRCPHAKSIIDVGTGSGAIAVTLALELGAQVIATDISIAALKVAQASACGANVQFIAADLLSALTDESMDVVASNPPYVPIADRKSMQREVRDWEPYLALFAGTTGLDVYRRLMPEAWRVLKPGGLLALELGFGQGDAVAALLSDWTNIEIAPDLAGIPRVISCEKP
jgi:release factor glutamine methyltransferase